MSDVFKTTKSSGTFKATKSDGTIKTSKSEETFKTIKSDETFNITKSNATSRTVNSKIRGLDLDTSRIKYNQSPVETPDGANKVFTLPSSHEYVTGLLEVYVDGVQSTKLVDWTETTSSTFTFTTAPDSDEAVRISYVKP